MEGDAGTRQLNPTDADETPDESLAVSTAESTDSPDAEESVEGSDGVDDGPADRRPSRLGIGSVVAICALLVLLAGGAAAGGYLALRSHHESEAIARTEAAALAAARDCVTATQAPDTAAMLARV